MSVWISGSRSVAAWSQFSAAYWAYALKGRLGKPCTGTTAGSQGDTIDVLTTPFPLIRNAP